MPALNLDLAVEQGSTWSHGFLPRVNGEAVLAEGWTARAQARATPRSSVVLHDWSTAQGNLGIDQSNGALAMTVDAAESSAWDWSSAYYDVEISSPDGDLTYRIAQGRLYVSPEVTREV